MIASVVLSKEAQKGLRRAPPQAVKKLQMWVFWVESRGIEAARAIRGFDDHSLKGERKGQRAIRLTKQWRAVYREQADGDVEFAYVEEVHPHNY